MSIQSKFDAALALLQEHNAAVGGQDQPGYVDPDKFLSCIKISGGTNEERLRSLSWEDILKCLPEFNGVKPTALAKDIAKVFRGDQGTPSSDDQKRPVSSKKAEKMTPRELVMAFDPEDADNPVGKRLKEISKGEPFVVFDNGRIVDVDTTFKLLQEIKTGYNGRELIEVGGETKKVYRVGELPDNFADENPFYIDRPLRPDGSCDQTNRSWEGVPLEVRQFVRVAIDLGELEVKAEKVHDILDMVLSGNGFDKLRKRYPKAAVKFNELKKTGDLPKLKVALGDGGSESPNPFDQGKKVVWAYSPQTNAYIEQHRLVEAARWKVRQGGTWSSNIAKRQ